MERGEREKRERVSGDRGDERVSGDRGDERVFWGEGERKERRSEINAKLA